MNTMQISREDLSISFEFFPPKTDLGREKLAVNQLELAKIKPNFFSVTYGAGGSTRNHTVDVVLAAKALTETPVAPHFSCIGGSKADIDELLQFYKQQDISRLIVIRGDLPSGIGLAAAGGDFCFANEFIQYIRHTTGDYFHCTVAAYPEVHPQADSGQADLDHFQQKVLAGADQAITQFFYNADAYYDFINQCVARNINIPIIPGILPITNYQNLARFAARCGAEIPRWLHQRLADFKEDLTGLQQFGEQMVTRLCQQLLAMGAPGLHFYSLNQSAASLTVLRNLSLISD